MVVQSSNRNDGGKRAFHWLKSPSSHCAAYRAYQWIRKLRNILPIKVDSVNYDNRFWWKENVGQNLEICIAHGLGSQEARVAEKQLLNQYWKNHGDSPVLNMAGTKPHEEAILNARQKNLLLKCA